MPDLPTSRRGFLAASTAMAAGAGLLPRGARAEEDGEAFAFEVTRTDEEWAEMLTRTEYRIMREGSTEWQRSSEHWDRPREEAGIYCCKGCNLTLYRSDVKVVLPIGWVFFRHSVPRAVLTDIDPVNAYGAEEMNAGSDLEALIEVHCRRCGSHLGHLVSIEGGPMHCINGIALTFQAEAA